MSELVRDPSRDSEAHFMARILGHSRDVADRAYYLGDMLVVEVDYIPPDDEKRTFWEDVVEALSGPMGRYVRA